MGSLVSPKWLDTRFVIPAKAGIQPTLLWIPACAGMTIVGRECRTIADVELFTTQYTRREGTRGCGRGAEASVEPVADGVGRGFGPVGAAGLSQYVLHVVGNGVEADDQLLGDFLVALADGQQTNYLDPSGG